MPVQVKKAEFLCNTKKKAPFIKILQQKLHENSIITKQRMGDVDVLLVEAATDYACCRKSSVAAHPDTNVLVIFLHHWKKSTTKNIAYSTKRKMSLISLKEKRIMLRNQNLKNLLINNTYKKILYLLKSFPIFPMRFILPKVAIISQLQVFTLSTKKQFFKYLG